MLRTFAERMAHHHTPGVSIAVIHRDAEGAVEALTLRQSGKEIRARRYR
jgi:hypothetical protein